MSETPATRIDPYNPLDLAALGDSLLRHLEQQPAYPLADVPKFLGSGIYALYYCGHAEPYAQLGAYNTEVGCSVPIYVGRARDPGARRGVNPLEPVQKPLLWRRIQDHYRSISDVANLNAEDFKVRALIVMPIWVPLAETAVIRSYRPVWNVLISGFGIHAPGGGRQQQKMSHWDELHPGRSFAKRLKRRQLAIPAFQLARLQAAIADNVAQARQRHELERPPSSSLRRAQAGPELRSQSDASPRPRRR